MGGKRGRDVRDAPKSQRRAPLAQWPLGSWELEGVLNNLSSLRARAEQGDLFAFYEVLRAFDRGDTRAQGQLRQAAEADDASAPFVTVPTWVLTEARRLCLEVAATTTKPGRTGRPLTNLLRKAIDRRRWHLVHVRQYWSEARTGRAMTKGEAIRFTAWEEAVMAYRDRTGTFPPDDGEIEEERTMRAIEDSYRRVERALRADPHAYDDVSNSELQQEVAFAEQATTGQLPYADRPRAEWTPEHTKLWVQLQHERLHAITQAAEAAAGRHRKPR